MPTDPLAPTDPFSRDDILSMTHQPVSPNPVPGIVKPAIDYLTSGDMMPAHKPGTQPKDYLRELLQYPDIMAKNIEQASNFAGMAGTTGAKPPRYLVTSPEGKKYILTGPPETPAPANLNKTPTEQFVDEYDALVSKRAAEINREDFHVVPKEGILAYHGSPHDFEKFDLSKIGTGEGAQAYGHGLYFAENEGVAQSYKQGGFQHMPEAVSVVDDGDRWAVYVGGRKKKVTYASKDEASAAADEIAKEIAPKGKMYQVGINADPEHFLDWDKPLSEQSPVVQQKLKDAWLAHPDLNIDLNDWHNTLRGWEPEQSIKQAVEAGIPGIKYLDQGSRFQPQQVDHLKSQVSQLEALLAQNPGRADVAKALAGRREELAQMKPTSNYVVFDDKLIDILKKYGWAGLGLPAMGAALPSEKNQ